MGGLGPVRSAIPFALSDGASSFSRCRGDRLAACRPDLRCPADLSGSSDDRPQRKQNHPWAVGSVLVVHVLESPLWLRPVRGASGEGRRLIGRRGHLQGMTDPVRAIQRTCQNQDTASPDIQTGDDQLERSNVRFWL